MTLYQRTEKKIMKVKNLKIFKDYKSKITIKLLKHNNNISIFEEFLLEIMTIIKQRVCQLEKTKNEQKVAL